MNLAPIPTISTPFNLIRLTERRNEKNRDKLHAIRCFLKDEGTYEEVMVSLDWLEEEYPCARRTIRKIRCYLIFEEFFEYEVRLSVFASCIRELEMQIS